MRQPTMHPGKILRIGGGVTFAIVWLSTVSVVVYVVVHFVTKYW